MKADTIKKFNNYCADVMGYDHDFKDDGGDAYNPYYNLYQVAAVVQELIKLTGEYPECEVFGRNASTWKIWHNFVISTMPNSEDGDKPEGWDEYINLHKEKLAAMENKEVIKGCVGKERFWEDENDEAEAKLKAKLRLELATYEDGMVSMEDYIGQIITVCNIHFIAHTNIPQLTDDGWHDIEEEGLPPTAWRYYDVYTFHREDENFRIIKKMFDDGGGRWEDDDGPYPHPVTHWKHRRTPAGKEEGTILDERI